MISIKAGVIALALTAATAAGAAWTAQGWRYEARIADIRSEHAGIMEAHAVASAAAMADLRSMEARRIAELEKARDTAQKQAQSAQADATAARAAGQRLRNRIDQMVADASTRDPTLTDGGPSKQNRDPIDLLAHVLLRHSEELVTVGRYADRVRVAAVTCEQSYDAIRGYIEQPE